MFKTQKQSVASAGGLFFLCRGKYDRIRTSAILWQRSHFFFLSSTRERQFLNAAVWRVRHRSPLGAARSLCPACRTMIRWYDNIRFSVFSSRRPLSGLPRSHIAALSDRRMHKRTALCPRRIRCISRQAFSCSPNVRDLVIVSVLLFIFSTITSMRRFWTARPRRRLHPRRSSSYSGGRQSGVS